MDYKVDSPILFFQGLSFTILLSNGFFLERG